MTLKGIQAVLQNQALVLTAPRPKKRRNNWTANERRVSVHSGARREENQILVPYFLRILAWLQDDHVFLFAVGQHDGGVWRETEGSECRQASCLHSPVTCFAQAEVRGSPELSKSISTMPNWLRRQLAFFVVRYCKVCSLFYLLGNKTCDSPLQGPGSQPAAPLRLAFILWGGFLTGVHVGNWKIPPCCSSPGPSGCRLQTHVFPSFPRVVTPAALTRDALHSPDALDHIFLWSHPSRKVRVCTLQTRNTQHLAEPVWELNMPAELCCAGRYRH